MKALLTAIALAAAALLGSAPARGSTAHLDRDFGSHGIRLLSGRLGNPQGTALLSDGRVLLGERMAVVALLPSGRIDPSFGVAGFAPFLGPAGRTATVAAVAVDPTGRPVACGDSVDRTGESSGGGSAVADEPVVDRYTAAGLPDPGFGGGTGFVAGGLPLPPPAAGEPERASAVGVSFDAAGHIYVSGQTQIGLTTGPRDEPVGNFEDFLARLK